LTQQGASILIVDDEQNLRRSLSLILQREGYQVTAAGNAADAMRYLEAGEFQLAFLDIKMPERDGMSLLADIREAYPSMPVFILTAHATLDSAMQAVRGGAKDYLLKPIDPEVIVRRVRETLEDQRLPRRRKEITSQLHELLDELQHIEHPPDTSQGVEHASSSEQARYLQRGIFTLDLPLREVTWEGRTAQLPPSTFNFLVSLLRHAPEPVAYQTLVRESQGYDLSRAEARELARGHVHELRKALEPDLKHPRYVVTVRDVGYRLIA
jgi:two-component system alkaline phosphatase synthesis response regulator PhoP